MTISTTDSALIDLQALFELRSRMLCAKSDLGIVYGAYLEKAATHPYRTTHEGRVILDSMREVILRTGLGRNTGTIARLTRTLESLGLLRIINMTNDSRDSMIMVLTRPILSELPRSFLGEERVLEAINHESLTQPVLSEDESSTLIFLSEVKLTQSVSKEVILPIYSYITNNKEINKNIDISNIFFYSSMYFLLWGRSESVLGYQRLNLTQKVVLELICTYQFDLDSLARYLGMRKNNLKSRTLKCLEEYLTIEDGIIAPRENIIEVLEAGFDQQRFDRIQRAIKGQRGDYCVQQREHMDEDDRKVIESLWDFLDIRREKKAAKSETVTALTRENPQMDGSEASDQGRYEKTRSQALGGVGLGLAEDVSGYSSMVASEESGTVAQDEVAEEESDLDIISRDIDGLGFKARGASVMKEVARVLLDDPDVLLPKGERTRIDGIKDAVPGLALTNYETKRALRELERTSLHVLLYTYRCKRYTNSL